MQGNWSHRASLYLAIYIYSSEIHQRNSWSILDSLTCKFSFRCWASTLESAMIKNGNWPIPGPECETVPKKKRNTCPVKNSWLRRRWVYGWLVIIDLGRFTIHGSVNLDGGRPTEELVTKHISSCGFASGLCGCASWSNLAWEEGANLCKSCWVAPIWPNPWYGTHQWKDCHFYACPSHSVSLWTLSHLALVTQTLHTQIHTTVTWFHASLCIKITWRCRP